MTCRKVVELNIQFSQGSTATATHLRSGGRFYSSSFCNLSDNAAVKELQLVNIKPSYCENKKGVLLWFTAYTERKTIRIMSLFVNTSKLWPLF